MRSGLNLSVCPCRIRKGLLAVENVVAAAPGGKTAILKGISFRLGAGELLGIVGPSAAGKSSLARVLVGVWQVAAGAVRLDGYELSHWDPQDLGKHLGYLPQDIELFAGTVAENIARFGVVDNEAGYRGCRTRGLPRAYPEPSGRVQHQHRR